MMIPYNYIYLSPNSVFPCYIPVTQVTYSEIIQHGILLSEQTTRLMKITYQSYLKAIHSF